MIQLEEMNEGGICHAFFTRRGGVSGGKYTSLNCGPGSSDNEDDVIANRARAMAALDLEPSALFTNHQIHSADVVTIETPIHPIERPKADALVTTLPGIAVGALSADCAPILFADPVDRIVGAAHAGWRGALGGVAEATIDAMIELGARPDNIRAAIGPCIGRDSYEVGPEFPEPFLRQDSSNAMYFTAAEREGHYMFDLSAYLAHRLSQMGLSEVFRLDCDTFKDEANFFSYRRSQKLNQNDYGRLLSAIALPPDD